jgi:hypothetical protein
MRPRAAVPLALLAVALLAGACQQASAPGPAGQGDPAILAAEALDARDYPRAATLYRQALARDPDNLASHFGLGVAASHLGLRDEAVREMSLVLERGTPGSREVEVAEHWLRVVGALRRPLGFPPPAPEPERLPERATLEGRALYGPTPGDTRPMERLKLSLIGQPNSPTREARYTVRTDRTGRYRIVNAVPGTYQLTDRIAGPPTWRLRIELKPGETHLLDLTPANSVRVRDDFPNEPQG